MGKRQVDLIVNPGFTGRQDAYHGIAVIIQAERFANNGGIGSVAGLPKLIAEDRDLRVFFFAGKVTAEDRAENR